MRLEAIKILAAEHGAGTQGLSDADASQYAGGPRNGIRRTIARWIKMPVAAPLLWRRHPTLLRELGCPIPFALDFAYKGYRFGDEAALHRFNTIMGDGQRLGGVLVVGCGSGYEVESWLRRRPCFLAGVDLFDYGKHWGVLAPQLSRKYRCPVTFRQAVAERLPFADNSFQVVHSQAVLEHIRNLDQGVREMTRILAPGGRMWHTYGPLYFSYGGDHCISCYGEASGYDHLLLDDAEYQCRVHDLAFFRNMPDPHCSYWARVNQFSFLGAKEYIGVFEKYLSIESVIAGITSDGLRFRERHRDSWKELLDAGITEADLLVEAMHVILRKPSREVDDCTRSS